MMGFSIKNKVEIIDNYVVKYNTAKFSEGLEWFTELFSINHKRELRVYNWYNNIRHVNLLIPNSYELTSKHIKIERLVNLDNNKIHASALIPNLYEFLTLGYGKNRSIFDIISSPTQSILRGLMKNSKFLGLRLVLQVLKRLMLLYLYRPKDRMTYLVHKDLKTNQNMIKTKDGVYFIDFGSSILTKDYFLIDIVELATDHVTNTVDFNIIKSLIKELGLERYNIMYLRSQIYLLLMRRTMHFGHSDRSNTETMARLKVFVDNLESLVNNFNIEEI